MKSEWTVRPLGELVQFISGGTPSKKRSDYWSGNIPWISAKTLKNEQITTSDLFISEEGLNAGSKMAPCGSILLLTRGSGLFNDIPIGLVEQEVAFNQDIKCLNSCSEVENKFIFYWLISQKKYLMAKVGVTGIGAGKFDLDFLQKLKVTIPSKQERDQIVAVADALSDKIKLNQKINKNLEQQAKALFINMFGEHIDSLTSSDTILNDLVVIVDNRGKTPPLSTKPTDYPIIDVRALSGNSRIVDYSNCSKYVSKDTYDNWFRSGHPKPYDILISTVGSLAEMKIFLGNVGCIAQNVIGFRCKDISPMYLYQYLNYIKHDLIAYNIGSVQPSIKVTHIIKHAIYVPSVNEIDTFDSITHSITEQIFSNYQENQRLAKLRDVLLPKLISGELDVSNIDL